MTDGRFKLIESLLPQTENPNYLKTIEKLERDFLVQSGVDKLDLQVVTAKARLEVRDAYP